MNRTQEVLRQPITFTPTTTSTHSRELIGRLLPKPPRKDKDRPYESTNYPHSFEGTIRNSNLSAVRASSAELTDSKRFFNTDYKMDILVQISMLKVGYFL